MRTTLIVCAAGLVLGALPAWAAERADDTPTAVAATVEELIGMDIEQLTRVRIVSTARKREETAFEIPSTVMVFPRSRLIEMKAWTIEDLQKHVPDFFVSTLSTFSTSATMRGLGAPVGTSPGVGLYIDGVYQIDQATLRLPFYDVERIEILKGPQGTLYGRNSFAGAINWITRPSATEVQADGVGEIGAGETRRGWLSVSGPIVGNSVSARITVGAQRQLGFRLYSNGAPADSDNNDYLSARLTFTPVASFKADFAYYHFSQTAGMNLFETVSDINDPHGHLLQSSPFVYGPFAGRSQFGGMEQQRENLRLTYSSRYFDVISVSSHDRTHVFELFDLDISPPDALKTYHESRDASYSEELRLQSKSQSAFRWLLGAYYTQGRSPFCCGATASGTLLARAPNSTTFTPYERGSFYGYSFFTDEEFMLADHWGLGAGLRLDVLYKSVDIGPPTNQTLSRTFWGLQPKFTLKYINDNTEVHVFIARGFREGGLNVQIAGATAGSVLAGTPYESYPNDSLWSYEAGAKRRVGDGRGEIDVSAFFINASSVNGNALLRVNDTPNGILFIATPLGQARSYGAELMGSYLFTRWFSLNVMGGYNHAELVSLSPLADPHFSKADAQVQFAPVWVFGGTGNLEIPVNQAGTRVGGFATITGVGPTTFVGNTAPAPANAHYIVDLCASVKWKKFSIAAFAKNLTNRTYPTNAFYGGAIQASGGTANLGATYNMPRYLGLQATANY
jgi:iron complex outermembrane receptor protein